MNRTQQTDRKVINWGSESDHARLAVLAVHGRGQEPAFMQEQSQRLPTSGLRFYAPTAPGKSWYPKPFLEPLEDNQPDLSYSLNKLTACVEDVMADGFAADRIVLWGFSQGACLLSEFVLKNPARYAGLILFTGGYLGPEAICVPAGRPLEGMPTILRSIKSDPWVPSQRVEQTASALEVAGADVDLFIAPGTEHIITDEAMATARRLLADLRVPLDGRNI